MRPDGALQHVAYSKFPTNLLHLYRPALVSEARIAGDHEQPAYAAERGDDLFDHAVRKIVLLGIAAHVLERQHGNRGLVRQSQRRLRRPRYRGALTGTE